MIRFEWDPLKAEANVRKHRISFEVACHVFDDPDAVVNHDQIEGGERRRQTVGMVSGLLLLLLVAHTIEFEEDEAEVVRIISARRADRKEKQRYEKAREENRRR
jgi:uncharacterized protein